MRVFRLKPYLRAMTKMGLSDGDMERIEAGILSAPFANPAIIGLKGVRKVRFARPGTGKSGGGRAIYYFVVEDQMLAMLTAYPKNVKDDLSADDRRAILRAIASILEDGE